MPTDCLYIPRDARGARAHNSRYTRAPADVAVIWLVSIQILPGIDHPGNCTRKLVQVMSVILSLSFFSWVSHTVGLLQ